MILEKATFGCGSDNVINIILRQYSTGMWRFQMRKSITRASKGLGFRLGRVEVRKTRLVGEGHTSLEL